MMRGGVFQRGWVVRVCGVGDRGEMLDVCIARTFLVGWGGGRFLHPMGGSLAAPKPHSGEAFHVTIPEVPVECLVKFQRPQHRTKKNGSPTKIKHSII